MLKVLSCFLLFIYVSELTEGKPLKKDYNYGLCTKQQFRCKNENCIKKSWFCDGYNHCGDGSDEVNCNSYNRYSCPTHYPFFMCSNRYRCIPKIWQCDGVYDCQDHSDEVNCLNEVEKIAGALDAERKAVSWIKAQRKNILGQGKWENNVLRTVLAFYLKDAKYFSPGNSTGEELSYEVEIKLLGRLLRKEHEPLSASELAIAIHALLVTCNDPREFHGTNLVEELRDTVDSQQNYTNPFVLLALCNAQETMTQADVDKLMKITREPFHPFWTDTKALALMALSCISEKQGTNSVPKFYDVASSLRLLQSSNGSIENVKTTALVMQALLASGEENDDEWNMEGAVKYLIKNQKADGSFGSFLNTYYTLPLFRYKTLLNISSDHCTNNTSEDDKTIIDDMRERYGKRVRVFYSLWFGDKVDVAKTMQLRVASNSSFFDVMRYASALDNRYRFEYSIVKGSPYIYSLSGVQDDPENDKFWFLYRSNNTALPERIEQSPSKLFAHDKEHFVMWYRTGHWNQEQIQRDGLLSNSVDESQSFLTDF